MIRIFNCNRNAIGQFMVALIFLGTFGFLFTFDGFATKPEAKGCCGGGEPAVTTFAADSSGDFGSDIPMDVESTDGCCGGQNKPIPSSSNNNGDGDGDGCECGLSCACNSPSDCDGTKTCPNVDAPGCCFDDAKYVCQCSSFCGGKGPTGCSGSGNCER